MFHQQVNELANTICVYYNDEELIITEIENQAFSIEYRKIITSKWYRFVC